MNPNRPILISIMQFEAELASGLTVFGLLDKARQLGVDGVELRRELWAGWQTEVDAVRQRASELGLILTYATFATLFNADEAGNAQLRQDIDTAAALGSPIFRVFQGPAPVGNDAADWAEAVAAVEYAAGKGIVIALENFAREPGGKLAEIKRVLDHIQHAALGTNIDIGNYVRHDEDVPNAIRTLGARAVSAHLKDQPTDLEQPPIYLGGGDQDLEAIFTAFEALPQRILYCFEFGGDNIETGIQRSIAYLQSRG